MRRIMIAAWALAFLPVYLFAQEKRQVPQLLARDGQITHPLTVSNAGVDVLIDGALAQTTITFTFHNDANRVLEGELVFPLPEGATVSGYGLDVNGVMVDGVAVEKLKARITYEQEVHKGIDPGLLEHVSGNVFRTRIYPIPAKGNRSVKVQYVSDVSQDKDGIVYSLPLDWGQPIGQCNLHIEAINATSAPTVRGKTFEGMEFHQANGRFVAERKLENERPADELVIVLPAPRPGASIQRRAHGIRSVDDSPARADEQNYYFAINDAPNATEAPRSAKASRIGILWDSSMSRQDADKSREIELVTKLLQTLGDVDVDLVCFRNVVDPPRTFSVRNGNADELLRALRATIYDGGTNLGAIQMVRNGTPLKDGAADARRPDYAYWLLFTDGNGDLGEPIPPKAEVPVYVVFNDDRSNHTILQYVAQQSGGAYLNLKRLSNEQALAGVGHESFSLISAEYQKDQIAEVYPSAGQAVHGRVTVTGKLLADEARITLNYGFANHVTHSQTFTLRKSEAADGGLIARQWAQMKVADLSIFPDKNRDALLEVGREFDMATPVTSLLVLETADQYVMHRIVPPRSRPDVYQEFAAKIEQQRAEQHRTEEERLQQVLAMWTDRQKWYDQKHEYAADFKYKESAQGNGAGGGPGVTNQLFASSGLASATPHPADGASQSAQRGTDDGEYAARRQITAQLPAPAPTAAPVDRLNEERAGRQPQEAAKSAPDFSDAPQFSLDASGREKEKKDESGAGRLSDVPVVANPSAKIELKEWDPNTPYLVALKKATPQEAYAVFLQQRKNFAASPAFFLDCADFFLRNNQRDLGIRILTDVAELRMADARPLRIVAHRLNQLGEREAAIDLFQKILALRPEEPQSHRDLALAISDRADDKLKDPSQQSLSAAADYAEALRLLNTVATGEWARFQGIQVIAVEEANRIIARLKTVPGGKDVAIPLDSRLIRNLDLDVRVVMTWDTDNTDIDLWVTEPTGEKCFYQHNRTTIGGLLSNDFTDGYGPEEYCLRKLMPGQYLIQANFYGSRQQALVGPTTVHATVITNFGRPDERRQSLTLRLTDTKEVVTVGTVKLDKP